MLTEIPTLLAISSCLLIINSRAFSLCGQGGDNQDSKNIERVIDGTKSDVGEWPWQALLFEIKDYNFSKIYEKISARGGGSIINNKWILTAAHVFNSQPSTLIVLGMAVFPEEGSNLKKHIQIYEPHHRVLHPDYESVHLDYDVALIRVGNRLKRNENKFEVDRSYPYGLITFSDYVRPVCLPCLKQNGYDKDVWRLDEGSCNLDKGKLSASFAKADTQAYVTGFGYANKKDSTLVLPGKLMKGLLKIFDNSRCEKIAKNMSMTGFRRAKFTNRMICAGTANKSLRTDSCQGDSGGPLVERTEIDGISHWVQVGIVSWGGVCGSHHPGFYVSVTAVMSWIVQEIEKTENRCVLPKIPMSIKATIGKTGNIVTGDTFHVKTLIIFECKNGLDIKGARLIQCREDGTWDNAVPDECDVLCTKPKNFKFGTITGDERIRYGEKISFSCDKGYELQGASTAQCQNGGRWSKDIPTCERIIVYQGDCPNQYKLHGIMCYRFYTTPTKYETAKEKCIREGGRLATIQSRGVESFIWDKLPSGYWEENLNWLGLTLQDWRRIWSTGLKFEEVPQLKYNLHDPRPNHCGAYHYRGRGLRNPKWEMVWRPCTNPYRFICEHWSKEASSYVVETPIKNLNGIYIPIAGIMYENRQVYALTKDSKGAIETYHLFYSYNAYSSYGWSLGRFSIRRTEPLSSWFSSTSDASHPDKITGEWSYDRVRSYEVKITKNDMWSKWSTWSSCSVTCGGGYEYRTRECTGGYTLGSLECRGKAIERRSCELIECENK